MYGAVSEGLKCDHSSTSPCCPTWITSWQRRLWREMTPGLVHFAFVQAKKHLHSENMKRQSVKEETPRNNSIVLVAETSYIESLHWTDTLILYIRNKFEILITLFLITPTHPHKILRTTELATLIITNLALCQAKVVVAIVSQTLTNDLFKYSILYLNDWFCA